MPESDTGDMDGADGTATFGTIVIRAWLEPGHDDGFRARLTYATDSRDEAATVVTGEPEDVVDCVRGWLANIQSGVEGSAPAADRPRS